MSIRCQICNKEMQKQVTNTHLKTHGMTVDEYKQIYGKDSLICVEYRNRLSEQRKGKNNPNFNNKWTDEQKQHASILKRDSIPWNKGIKLTDAALEHAREAVRKREDRYMSGDIVRHSPTHTSETRRILSARQTEYASKNKQKMSERAKKAIETKKNQGYDLAFFKDKKHTKETIEILSAKSKLANQNKTTESTQRIMENAKRAKCTVLAFEDNRMLLQCDTCSHEFSFTRQYFIESKFTLESCPSCFPRQQSRRSIGETELYNFIASLGIRAIPNCRDVLKRKEVDIYLPDYNIAVEYNGLYWHSEKVLESIGQSKTKDNEKRIELLEKNVRYIAVFEDEWVNNAEIVKSRLASMLGKIKTTIPARKCQVRKLDSKTAAIFCENNHIQGKGRSNERYGLYYQDQLVSVMTFSKSNLSRKINDWELNRFCHKTNVTVVGGASKLFKAFIREHQPQQVVTYADSRWSDGNLYKQLGFTFSHHTVPNYWYALSNDCRRMHRFALRKKHSEDQTKTEKQLRDEQGYLRIWDCGSSKWIWKGES